MMLVHPLRVTTCRISSDPLISANPCAVNSVGALVVKNPKWGRGFSRRCRLQYCSGRAKKWYAESGSFRVLPTTISASEVEGSLDLDGGSSSSNIPGAAAFELETVIHDSASASASASASDLLSSDTETAAQEGEWRSLGRDGGVEHLSTSSSGNGLAAFTNILGAVSFGPELEPIQRVEWPVDLGDTVAQGQERNVDGLNSHNGHLPLPEIYKSPTEEAEDLADHIEDLPTSHEILTNTIRLDCPKRGEEPLFRFNPAPGNTLDDNNAQRPVIPKPESDSTADLQEDIEYYIPKVGDVVTGVVVSGNEFQLDIEIGSKQLGRMLSKDVKPLDPFRPDEFFWELDESGTSMPSTTLGQVRFLGDREPLNPTHPVVPVGTVLSLLVFGVTFSGKALLSARKVASRIAWQRVRQIHEQDEPIEAQCVAWNSEGLVFKIEGLRAVLPLNEFLNRPSEFESLKDHVGEWKNVLITCTDKATEKFVVSEKRAWGWRYLRIGSLVTGTVSKILPFGVEINLAGTSLRAMLHISNISRAYIPDVKSIFTVGEKVKGVVTESGSPRRIGISTADLERTQGLMLVDKERVYQEAKEMAALHRSSLPTDEINEESTDAFRLEEPCFANQDWLEFGEGENMPNSGR